MKHFLLAWLILFSSQAMTATKKKTTPKPTVVSAEKVTKDLKRARAIEAAIWGMPLVNFDAMRQAYFRDASASYNDVIYLSRPADEKFQILTPNNSTNYVMFFSNLKDGPIIVEVPKVGKAALFGSIIDSWNDARVDVGNTGMDKGKGAKYFLIPPGYKGKIPKGVVPVEFATNNLYGAFRVIPKSNSPQDMNDAINYLKSLKVYPLGTKTPTLKYIDIANRNFNALPVYDERFYTSLAKMVREEPVKKRDMNEMYMLETLGISKSSTFSPSSETSAMLKTAAKEAETYMRNGFKNLGPTWWEGKKWKNVVTMKKTETVAPKAETKTPATATETETEGYFVQNEKILVDERAFVFASACAGTHDNIPNLYVKTYEDKTGKNLTGENVYHLRVPGNVPTTQYWSVVAYDSETAAFIDNSQSVGIDSYDQNVKKNPDGSVDIYFGPTAPMGLETNWISTTKGRPFFVFFRNYSPSPDVLDRTSPWSLNDIERLSAGESKQAQEEKK